ncbi:MAG: MFS transporter [Verrucomicrobiae bacterium]|nr:MFS transporter [Verrucomicrobiae bacterium]
MRQRAALGVLFFTVFVDLVGFGLVLPLLPYFASRFGANGFEVTALSSIFSLMQFVFAPFWGRLSDRIGRRPVILISLAGSTLSYFGLMFCESFWQIFATRAFAGFFGANIAVANAYIADITPPEERSKGMGWIGAAFGLGFVLGPGLGALIAHLADDPLRPDQVYRAIGGTAAAICGLNGLVACWTLAESRPSSHREVRRREAMGPLAAWRRVFAARGTAYLIALYFALGYGFANFENLFALLLIRPAFGFDVREGNLFFLYLGLVMAVVQGGMIGRLAKRFGDGRLIAAGCILSAVAMAWMPFADRSWHLFLLLGLLGLGQGLNRASILGLVSRRANAEMQGAALGAAQSAGSLARIVGPISGGALFDRFGPPAPFLLSGVLVALVLLPGIGGLRREDAAAATPTSA